MTRSEFLKGLDDRIEAKMAELNVPGCAFALIEGAAPARVEVYGLAETPTRTPVTCDTRFCLQSISKAYAAWAVMILVEAGAVDLDAPINGYLKRWRLPPSDAFDLDLVTPRRLLSHHGGVTVAGFTGVEYSSPGYTLVDAMNCELPPMNEEQRRHWSYWKLADPEPVRVTTAPGAAYNYSNAGFGLLELAIEDVTGQSYADFVTERLFQPLGMDQSTFVRSGDVPFAWPHGRDGARAQDYLWPSLAAAGVYATIGDLVKFACAEMTGPGGEPPGRGVVSPGSIALMHASNGKADQSSGIPFEAGLGHMLLRGEGPLNVHHSGGSIGWRSIYSIFPETGDGVCMLMNGEAANDVWVPLVRDWREALSV